MLEQKTDPYRLRIDENLEKALEIAQWLRRYPNCHPDERRAKFALWKALMRENEQLLARWTETRDAWIRTRMNRPVEIGEVVRDLRAELDA
jgi:hypothetical protein